VVTPVLKPSSVPAPVVPGVKSLRLLVVEEGTGTPLAGVTVEVSTFTDLLRSARKTLMTDAAGTVEVQYPTEARQDFYHRVHLSKDGYVPRYVSWSKFQKDDLENILPEYKATMGKGSTIGGVVRSRGGETISGAAVVFSGGGPVGVPPRERDTVMGNYHTEKTDQNGEWRCTHVRSEFQTLTFQVEHPNHQTTIFGCEETSDPSRVGVIRLPDNAYRAAKAEMIVEPGLRLSGIVMEKGGAAIGAAAVTLNRQWRKESATTRTTVTGEFALGNGRPGDLKVSVQASGFAPVTMELAATSNVSNLRFELSRSMGVRGRVLDETGMPIRNAEIEFEKNLRWERIFDWQTRSDEFGNFFWDSSPNEPFNVSVFASGYVATNALMKPGNDEQTITLTSLPDREPVMIRGVVVDSASGRALDGAEIYLSDSQYGQSPPHRVAETKGGEFSLKLDQREASYQIEVRHQGYEPARSKPFRITEPVDPFRFSLAQGGDIAGVVLSPEGTPVAGAEVALCTQEKQATLGKKKKFLFTDQSAIARTDADGKFTHQRLVGAHHLYAVHELGYAEVRLKDWTDGVLKLQPWARLEGRLTAGGQPIPGEQIFLEPAFFHGIEQLIHFYGITAETDSQGQFVIDDLPPIEVRVSWMRRLANSTSSSNPVTIALLPGQTARLDYAIGGLTVTGKLLWAGEGKVDWSTQARGSLQAQRRQKPWEQTPGYAQATPEQRQEIEFEFPYTEAGREHMRRQRFVPLSIEADGRFTATFVEPGEYSLWLSVSEKSQPNQLPGRVLATLRREGIAINAAETFDLGEIRIEPRNNRR
jgi:hypothetical protein